MNKLKNSRIEYVRTVLKGYLPFYLIFSLVIGIISIDIYMPSLPQMMVDLNTTREAIQFTICASIISSSVMTVVIGPLADAWGRRPFLLIGQVLFTISTLAASYVESIGAMLVVRTLQGVSLVGAMVLVFAIISDRYRGEEALKYYAYSTTAITLSLVAAPLIGGFFGEYYTWRTGFVFLGLSGICSVIFVYFGIPETLSAKKPYHFTQSIKGYQALLGDFHFLGLTFIPSLLLGCKLSFFAVGSFYFIHEVGVSVGTYGLYQGIIMLSNASLNTFIPQIIRRWGKQKVTLAGFSLLTLGACGLFLSCIIFPQPEFSVIVSMSSFSTGLGLIWSIFLNDTMSLYPEKAGTVSSAMSMIRGWLMALLITTMSFIYNHHLFLVSCIILSILLICLLIYRFIIRNNKKIIV